MNKKITLYGISESTVDDVAHHYSTTPDFFKIKVERKYLKGFYEPSGEVEFITFDRNVPEEYEESERIFQTHCDCGVVWHASFKHAKSAYVERIKRLADDANQLLKNLKSYKQSDIK